MAFSRYRNSPQLALGSQYGTSRAVATLRNAILSGQIPILDTVTLVGNQRLDHLAAIYYKDSRYWWVLAAASEIGWGMQLPPGTIISIPDLDAVSNLIG
jgi:hypothetical protein